MQLDMFHATPRVPPPVVANGVEKWRFEMGGKAYLTRFIEFEVRQKTGGGWERTTRANFNTSGNCGPLCGQFETREAAINDCLKTLIRTCTFAAQDVGEAAAKEANKALSWLQGFNQ